MKIKNTDLQITGASYLGDDKCFFSVWAPEKENISLYLLSPERTVPMKKGERGYFTAELNDISPGAKYFFDIDGKKIPDPSSGFQPEGVHGPSAVVNHNDFEWHDQTWKGIAFQDLILYELHVGTFSETGTFEAMIPMLDDLLSTGINAIELLPVAQFPGERNWGYDGVFPYAVQNSYGGPTGLKKLVDACHEKGIAVYLDVVYNHLGPEGNYFSFFGPYFTHQYATPWGDALNFDGARADGVRDFFAANALYWLENFHIDGLRLDAIHAVYDNSAVHFWEYVNNCIKKYSKKTGRHLYAIAESDLNDPRVIRGPENGGFGFTAQWLDDFHHALYVLLHEAGKERYYDFGLIEQFAKACSDGFVHSGEYVTFRKRKYGRSSAGIPGDKFVVFHQNHDQIGNRVLGERLGMLVDFERLKIAAAAVLLAPYVPMLFMGEEYADPSPFLYFVSHTDKELVAAVRKGRKEEFKHIISAGEPPDPQDPKTFLDSKLKWKKRETGEHAILLKWYKQLIKLRKSVAAFQNFSKDDVKVSVLGEKTLMLHRQSESGTAHAICLFNFSDHAPVTFTVPGYGTDWKKLIDSGDLQWNVKSTDRKEMPATVHARSTVVLHPLRICVYHF
jgi:maltooligosyltrehalose trehalohydrolase